MTRTGLMRPQSAKVNENEWDAAVAAFQADGADTGYSPLHRNTAVAARSLRRSLFSGREKTAAQSGGSEKESSPRSGSAGVTDRLGSLSDGSGGYSPLHRNTAIAAQSLRSSLSGQAGGGQRGSFGGGGGFGGGRRTAEKENTEAQTKAPTRNTELAVQSLRKALRQAPEGEATQPDKRALRLFQAGFDADAASYNPKRVAAQVDALTRRETQQARLAELTQQYSQLYRHGQQQKAESLAPAIRQLQAALAQSDRRTFLQKAADGIKKAGNSLGDIADSFISVGGTRTLADILSLGGTLDEFLSLPIGTKGEEDYVSPLRQDAEELRSAAELELTQNLEDEPPLVRLACELAAGGGSDALAGMMMTSTPAVPLSANTAKTYIEVSHSIKKTEKIHKLIKSNDTNKRINVGHQNKHIPGANGYIEGKSYIFGTLDDAQNIVDEYHGTGRVIFSNNGKWAKKEVVTCDHDVGVIINSETGEKCVTNRVSIHYGKKGVHIIPANKEVK